jgi:hypothetical protein
MSTVRLSPATMSSLAKQASLLLEQLFADSSEFAPALLAWLSKILADEPIRSLTHLADHDQIFHKFASATNLLHAIPLSPYLNSSSLSNYVLHLQEVWRDLKDVPIYTIFTPFLKQVINQSFEFETDFDTVIYSYTSQIFGVILTTSMLTVLLVNQDEDDDRLTILHKSNELSPEFKEAFEQGMEKILLLYEELIAATENLDMGMTSICNLGAESRRRITTINDIQMCRKVEDQQLTIDTLQRDNENLKFENSKLTMQLNDSKKKISEAEQMISQLSFSRNDLLDKLKSHSFNFEQEELKIRGEEISKLKETLSQREKMFRGSIRELEDDREFLHKKIHQLENYKTQLENTASHRNISMSFDAGDSLPTNGRMAEEIKELKAKCAKLEQLCFKDKERCLHLEMEIVRLGKELDLVKNDRREIEFKFREMASISQINNISDSNDENFADIAEELSINKVFDKFSKNVSKLSIDDESSLKVNGHSSKARPVNSMSTGSENNPNMQNSPSANIGLIQQEVKLCLVNYEKKCLNRIKSILKSLEDAKDTIKEQSRENEELKNQIDDLHEKTHDLESMTLERMLSQNQELKTLVGNFDENNKEKSTVAQDLLKSVMRKDLEIARLNHNKRKLYNQSLLTEGRCLESMSLMYSVIQSYVGNA